MLPETEAGPATDFILQAAALGEAVSHDAGQGMQRYGFKVGPWSLLFPENCPGEIVTDVEICPIPHTRHWMRGVIALRGNLIPVFDLHAMLLEAPLSPPKPMVLILDQGRQALGFLLQEPPQWLSGLVEAPATAAMLPDKLAAKVSKLYRQQEINWLAFDKTAFFAFLAENAKSC